jgi:hypothetical protein
MHIALARNKTSLNSASHVEDKLTSMFFGTLQYLPSKAIAYFISELFNSLDKSEGPITSFQRFINSTDIEFKFDFWPNIKNDGGRVEPDLVITAKKNNSDKKMRLLIECKWESEESGQNQLLKQWNAVSDKNETIHIFLIKNRDSGEKCLEENLGSFTKEHYKGKAIWEDRLHAITWYDVMAALKNKQDTILDRESARIYEIWRNNLKEMFERIGIDTFNGFNQFKRHYLSDIREYFLDLTVPIEQSEKLSMYSFPIFWNDSVAI